jgi:hypothetical protein
VRGGNQRGGEKKTQRKSQGKQREQAGGREKQCKEDENNRDYKNSFT